MLWGDTSHTGLVDNNAMGGQVTRGWLTIMLRGDTSHTGWLTMLWGDTSHMGLVDNNAMGGHKSHWVG